MPEIIYLFNGRVVYRLPVKPEELDLLQQKWRREKNLRNNLLFTPSFFLAYKLNLWAGKRKGD